MSRAALKLKRAKNEREMPGTNMVNCKLPMNNQETNGRVYSRMVIGTGGWGSLC